MTPVLYPAAPFVPRGSLETGPNPLSQPWPVSVPDSPGKVAHNGSQGQPGCEWTLAVPSCANKFFFDYSDAFFAPAFRCIHAPFSALRIRAVQIFVQACALLCFHKSDLKS